jgi:hypothetical protein
LSDPPLGGSQAGLRAHGEQRQQQHRRERVGV